MMAVDLQWYEAVAQTDWLIADERDKPWPEKLPIEVLTDFQRPASMHPKSARDALRAALSAATKAQRIAWHEKNKTELYRVTPHFFPTGCMHKMRSPAHISWLGLQPVPCPGHRWLLCRPCPPTGLHW